MFLPMNAMDHMNSMVFALTKLVCDRSTSKTIKEIVREATNITIG